MSLLSAISRFGEQVRRRHRQAQTMMYVASLPEEIQKDIGWPDMYERSTRSNDEPRR
ncbi:MULTISPECIES: hypothetical protein [unclassified Aminobacter]|jgi:hypothetical protein|uniref:hypothetical protein n=1 Tax=unclassified Aminobacter TaxID=2644704 RepID=UPI0004AE7B42|nr:MULTISPECIES: hypothetical protein [unclassified Aminobacter]TWG64745.1 hypothetical protein L610_001600000270 [Aminobacter sp. J44]TWH36750.1 hypothetical protein L611_000100002320 [Aminobacter sp. J15]